MKIFYRLFPLLGGVCGFFYTPFAYPIYIPSGPKGFEATAYFQSLPPRWDLPEYFNNVLITGTLEDLKHALKEGADLNKIQKETGNVLHFAARNKDPRVIEFILSKGFNPEAKTAFGLTPLHNAADFSTPTVIQILLLKGVDINAKTNIGFTPLHYADIPRNVRALLLAGADPHVKDNKGKTPLDYIPTFTYLESHKTIEALLTAAMGGDLSQKGRTSVRDGGRSLQSYLTPQDVQALSPCRRSFL